MADYVLIMLGSYLSAAKKWAIVLDRVVELAELKEKLFDGGKIKPHEDLPQDLAFGLLRLYFFVRSMFEWDMEQLETLVSTSPPVRHLFQRFGVHHERPDAFTIRRSKAEATASETEFLQFLNFMSMGQCRWNTGARACVQELERITQCQKGRQLVTRYIAERVSDICIMSECTRQIESFEPWFTATLYRARTDKALYVKVKNDHYKTALTMIPAYRYLPSSKTRKLGARIAQMRYPANKGYSKANMEAMQAAERSLDEFWEIVISELEIAGI